MKSFLKYVKDKVKGKHAVIAMARMNPMTIGHEKAVESLKSTAEKKGADHLLLISHTHDGKKNPLTPDEKMKHLKNNL